MTDEPTIVLAHGFWGGAAHWTNVIVELNKRGYDEIRAVENPLTSLADDAERTRKMVGQVDGSVVLVGHSYGGAVITEVGDLPNVKALVYIAAFAPDAGESPGRISQEHPPAAFDNIAPDSDGYPWITQDKFHESFAQDLAPRRGARHGRHAEGPRRLHLRRRRHRPAWRNKPVWYQVSTRDRMIHPDNERRMAERTNPRKVVELEATHASLASRPQAAVDLIEEVVRETAG
ncbi:alpha/beta hydrolase [Streptomyces cinereoruber]|uniref:alpha/beta hydrolase n=1 Tax=Streptomyces cinereoruber TaxID=67260 RepID=UPI003EC0C11A